MVALNELEEVTFITSDEELNSVMLEGYPGIIKGEQHRVEKIDGERVYVFEDLQLDELTAFLRDKGDYKYFMAHI